MGSLYALDFDGVLCDSCGESSLSAVKAAKVKWPELFTEIEPETEAWILDNMRTVRPVVETGYENLLLVRLLLEMKKPTIQKSSVVPGLNVEGILENWSKLRPIIMKEWDAKKEELVDLFGNIRDDWMEQDLSSWIGANRFYPGTADAIRFASSKIYIVTTKQSTFSRASLGSLEQAYTPCLKVFHDDGNPFSSTRFAEALLRDLAGVNIPPERIYGLGTGPKVEVLKELQSKPEHSQMSLHFVEDRLATLKNVIKEPELDKWNLYLGTWGYNTPVERKEASNFSRISILDLNDFCAKLK